MTVQGAGRQLQAERGDRLTGPGVEVVHRNIEDDLGLIRRYGDRVPVLFRLDTRAELGWPFDAERVRAFVAPASD